MNVLFGVGFIFFFLVLGIGGLALMIYTLVDAIRMPNDTSFKSGTQLVWILVILLAQGIGALIYLFVGRPPGGATGARQRMVQPPQIPPPPT